MQIVTTMLFGLGNHRAKYLVRQQRKRIGKPRLTQKWVANTVGLCVVALLGISQVATAQGPSYSRQVGPFFQKYCVECHGKSEPEGGLVLESYKGLMAGGDHGVAVVAGKADMSLLVRMIEGKQKPIMPPRKAKQPKPEEVALVRAWVADGAKDDGAAAMVRLPVLRPKGRVAPAFNAVAITPDDNIAVVSGRGEIILIDAATGETKGKLPVGKDRVTAIAISSEGTLLAVAASTLGIGHEVRLWRGEKGNWQGKGKVVIQHQDVVQNLVFSRDGKLLASASYDRLVKLWDVGTGKERHTLRDHSDSVYGVAFSPDGKLLASAGADRAIKVWDVVSGKRLYTLSDSTDWVYAVAWSPTGKQLAAAGVDRSIRVWDVAAEEGTLVGSVFAHEKAVTRLVYSANGKSLFSLGEDNKAKQWDAQKLSEQKVFSEFPETPLSLAVGGSVKEVFIGRFDGVLTAIDVKTGTQRQVLPVKMKAPVLEGIKPAAVRRGSKTELELKGSGFVDASVVSDLPGLTATVVGNRIRMTVPENVRPGVYGIQLKNAVGLSARQSVVVDRFALVMEQEPNDSASQGQKVILPVTVSGVVSRPGDVDWYRFEAKAGDEVGVQVLTGEVGSKLAPVLTLVDQEGKTLTESVQGHLGYKCSQAGWYALRVRDREYNGGASLSYRLHVGSVPVVTSYFPLGGQRGTKVAVKVEGVHLPRPQVQVDIPATAAVGSRVAVGVMTAEGAPLGAPSLVVGEFAEIADPENRIQLSYPSTANGRIATPGQEQTWRYMAKKGQRAVVEVEAERIGSPLDSTLEILDGVGKPLPRAVLRSLARTYIAFRDHDSRSPGIRLETWGELVVNDYLLVGSEVLKIRALPRNPDDDCQFFAEQGQRIGYFGTTPVQRCQGLPMYKISVHPPGTRFPANGLPLVTLYWRNDDGGPGFGKDSRIVFDPPADGMYQIRVKDSRGEGSLAHAYRLTVRPPKPDFTVRASVAGTVSRGGAVPVRVDVTRLDELDGVIDVKLVGLPDGLSAPGSNIFGSDNGTILSLAADGQTARVGEGQVKVQARAKVHGKDVIREATFIAPKVIEPGDIVTSTVEKAVTVRRGGEVRVTVQVERRNGFTGRIPVEVLGLPHGVRVLDVGLNGILVTPTETRRTIVLKCENWVEPMEHPISVTARHERKGSEHSAPSVLLRVTK